MVILAKLLVLLFLAARFAWPFIVIWAICSLFSED
jgi:hypothetical protein